MVKYYPKEFNLVQIAKQYPDLELGDLDEEQRFEDIARRKARGKGAPKKAKNKGPHRPSQHFGYTISDLVLQMKVGGRTNENRVVIVSSRRQRIYIHFYCNTNPPRAPISSNVLINNPSNSACNPSLSSTLSSSSSFTSFANHSSNVARPPTRRLRSRVRSVWFNGVDLVSAVLSVAPEVGLQIWDFRTECHA